MARALPRRGRRAGGRPLHPARPEEERFLTAALVRDLTTTGTADELVERVARLADAGFQQLTICLAPGQDQAVEEWARVLERV